MKVSELTGVKLDYWVASAQAMQPVIRDGQCYVNWSARGGVGYGNFYAPSTDWSQGGPIIERERGSFVISYGTADENQRYVASMGTGIPRGCLTGPTHLIAAMRAYVASKFGEEVPDDLGITMRTGKEG